MQESNSPNGGSPNIGDVVNFGLVPLIAGQDLPITADTLTEIAREISDYDPARRVYTLPDSTDIWDALFARIA